MGFWKHWPDVLQEVNVPWITQHVWLFFWVWLFKCHAQEFQSLVCNGGTITLRILFLLISKMLLHNIFFFPLFSAEEDLFHNSANLSYLSTTTSFSWCCLELRWYIVLLYNTIHRMQYIEWVNILCTLTQSLYQSVYTIAHKHMYTRI